MYTLYVSRLFPLLFMMINVIPSADAMHHVRGYRVIIDKPVYDSIYITAGYIIVNVPVHGDVIIAGGDRKTAIQN